jgi:hypothetical protein
MNALPPKFAPSDTAGRTRHSSQIALPSENPDLRNVSYADNIDRDCLDLRPGRLDWRMTMKAQRYYGDGEISVLPPIPELDFPAGAFVVCPPGLRAGPVGSSDWFQEVYRIAFEQAQAGLWLSPFERARQEVPN